MQAQSPGVSIDRATAARINPLIGSVFTEDTLCQVSAIVSDIGYLLSAIAQPNTTAEPEFRSLYLFCNVISSALNYEISNPRLAGAAKEHCHA